MPTPPGTRTQWATVKATGRPMPRRPWPPETAWLAGTPGWVHPPGRNRQESAPEPVTQRSTGAASKPPRAAQASAMLRLLQIASPRHQNRHSHTPTPHPCRRRAKQGSLRVPRGPAVARPPASACGGLRRNTHTPIVMWRNLQDRRPVAAAAHTLIRQAARGLRSHQAPSRPVMRDAGTQVDLHPDDTD